MEGLKTIEVVDNTRIQCCCSCGQTEAIIAKKPDNGIPTPLINCKNRDANGRCNLWTVSGDEFEAIARRPGVA